MQQIVREEHLSSIDIREFHSVWAVRDSDDSSNFSGVEIKPDRRMAPLVSPDTPAPLTITSNLLIIVENPDDPETVNRLKAFVGAAWSANS